MHHLKLLALAAVLSATTAAAPANAEIARADGAKQALSAPSSTSTSSRQQAYCKNGVSYTFTYNSDGTIATMSWTYDECVAAGGK